MEIADKSVFRRMLARPIHTPAWAGERGAHSWPLGQFSCKASAGLSSPLGLVVTPLLALAWCLLIVPLLGVLLSPTPAHAQAKDVRTLRADDVGTSSAKGVKASPSKVAGDSSAKDVRTVPAKHVGNSSAEDVQPLRANGVGTSSAKGVKASQAYAQPQGLSQAKDVRRSSAEDVRTLRANGVGTSSAKDVQALQPEDWGTPQRLRRVYRAEVGVREATGRNDGPRVEEYLAHAGFGPGAPWCAAFVGWCHAQAGIPACRSAWSPAWFPKHRTVWLRQHGSPYRWEVGDVFGIYYPNLGRVGHVGFVDSVCGNLIFTVEGNTNAQGSREGQGVWRKRRPLRTVWGASRWRKGL